MIGSSDIGLLPALDALLKEANVTRAAARLNISQPSLSSKLARLRHITGDALLVPSGQGRGMVLTPRAIELRAQVRELLAGVTTVLGAASEFDPASTVATLRIIANDNAASLTLAMMLEDVAAKGAHGIRVALLRPDVRSLADRLESGDADLAVALDRAFPGSDRLHRRPILQDCFAVAQRKGHPRGRGPMDIDAYCAANHLLVSASGDAFSGVVDEKLHSLGRRRRVALSVHSYTLAPTVIARTDLIGTLPRNLLEQHSSQLDLFEPPVDLETFTLVALWHERTHDDAFNRWMRERLFAIKSAHEGR